MKKMNNISKIILYYIVIAKEETVDCGTPDTCGVLESLNTEYGIFFFMYDY
jgi:hypothetical protein